MKYAIALAIAMLVVGVIVGRGCRPAPAVFLGPITTVHDTIEVPGPEHVVVRWQTKVQKFVKRETVNKLIRETVIKKDSNSTFAKDTFPRLYNVYSLLAGQRLGDTTFVRTARASGDQGVSMFLTTGPILAVQAGFEPAPQISFGEFPQARRRHGLITDILLVGAAGTIGYASCRLEQALR